MCGGRANRGQEKISTSQILIFLHQTMEALIIIDIKLTQVYKGINLSKYSFTKYKQKSYSLSQPKNQVINIINMMKS